MSISKDQLDVFTKELHTQPFPHYWSMYSWVKEYAKKHRFYDDGELNTLMQAARVYFLDGKTAST